MRKTYVIRERRSWQPSCCQKTFLTRTSAAKHIAWRMINEKYGWDLQNTKTVAGLDCECQTDTSFDGGGFTDYNGCPIHDRKTGYFRMVTKRLTRLILSINDENTAWHLGQTRKNVI